MVLVNGRPAAGNNRGLIHLHPISQHLPLMRFQVAALADQALRPEAARSPVSAAGPASLVSFPVLGQGTCHQRCIAVPAGAASPVPKDRLSIESGSCRSTCGSPAELATPLNNNLSIGRAAGCIAL